MMKNIIIMCLYWRKFRHGNQRISTEYHVVGARSDRAYIQVLAMAPLNGFGSRTMEREKRIFDPRSAVQAHTEVVMVRDSSVESIVGMVNHHGKKKVMAISTS
jgi:hypothetical protein